MKLEGRSAFITGGSRGVGRGMALVFAREGADVVINYRRDEDAARETVAEIRKIGRKAVAVKGDVMDPEDCQRNIDEAVTFLGKLDLLVNNAGIASRGRHLMDTEEEEMQRVIAIHILGSFYMSKYALPHLRANSRSDIFFVSSGSARSSSAGSAPYTAAKAGMEGMARCLATEERPNNIRVNILAPGLVNTEMGRRLVRATRGVEDINEIASNQPFGRLLQPEDIGMLGAFLASAESELITGQFVGPGGAVG